MTNTLLENGLGPPRWQTAPLSTTLGYRGTSPTRGQKSTQKRNVTQSVADHRLRRRLVRRRA
eukprot:4167174-Lingulodinium_polyedra.AAC.1